METKNVIIFFIIMVVLVSSILVIYFSFEKPEKEKEIILKNVFFSIENNATKESVKSDIQLSVDGVFYKNVTSQINSFVLAKVPINKSVKINVELEDYYSFEDDLFFNENITNDRYIIRLNKKGNISVDYQIGEMQITLFFERNGVIESPVMCIEYSDKFIYFKSNTYAIKKEKINGEFKCFYIGDGSEVLDNILTFNNFGELTKDDYLNIKIYDEYGGENELLYEKKINFV